MPTTAPSRILGVHPLRAIEGGRVSISGRHFGIDPEIPEVRFGQTPARVCYASSQQLTAIVPEGLDGGRTPVRIASAPGEAVYVDVGVPLATGLHLVDNPVYDREGNLYVTFSGSRGQQAPVAVFVVRRDGSREPFVSDIANPTSLAFGPDGHLYVSSRFDGAVYRVESDGTVTPYATDLGVACGIAFDADGVMYVGDRSGSVLRVADGNARLFAALPSSVAAYHLAFGPDGSLYVTAPTLAARDAVFRISRQGGVETLTDGFGRPQGIAFDGQGRLYVVDALAGRSGLFRLDPSHPTDRELLVDGGAPIGLAFDPLGGLALATSTTVYRFD